MTTRRRLLQGAGLGLVLPPLGGVRRSHAIAPVRRLIIMTTPQQMMPQSWQMRRGRPDGAVFADDLSSVPDVQWSRTLAPLAPYKSRLTAIEGLSLYAGIPAGTQVNAHDASCMNLLTSAGLDPDNAKRSMGPSVDQVIAASVARAGQLRSLELGSHPYLGGVVNIAADQRAPVIESPLAAFTRVFPEAGAGAPPHIPTVRDKIEAARAGVADFVRREYQTVAPRLGVDDRVKFELHTQMLSDIQSRLAVLSQRADCKAPQEQFPDNQTENRERFEMYARITAAGLACDRTRVVTIQVRELFNRDFDAPPGDLHQDFAHHADEDDNAAEMMSRFNRVYAGYFAYLLAQLAQYSDGDGTLLDHCLVVWMNEHGLTRGPHSMTEAPIILAGGGAGAIRTGRYISVARTTPHPMTGMPIGTPHAHLLISLMQAMGLPDDAFGLPEVRTADGRVVSLKGPLADLR